MLKISHISKTFNPGTVNEKKALEDFSLELKKGDFATIIGSNGLRRFPYRFRLDYSGWRRYYIYSAACTCQKYRTPVSGSDEGNCSGNDD